MLVLLSCALLPAQTSKGTLKGHVRDVTGAIFAGAAIILLDSRTGALRTTKVGTGGEYSFEGLQAGKYELRVEGLGFFPDVHVMWIPQTTEVIVDSVLNVAPTHGYGDVFVKDKKTGRTLPDDSEYRGAILGDVRDQYNHRIPEVRVVAENVDTHESRSTETGKDGRFVLDGLPKGFYKVRADCKGYWRDYRTARIEYGDSPDIELEIESQ